MGIFQKCFVWFVGPAFLFSATIAESCEDPSQSVFSFLGKSENYSFYIYEDQCGGKIGGEADVASSYVAGGDQTLRYCWHFYSKNLEYLARAPFSTNETTDNVVEFKKKDVPANIKNEIHVLYNQFAAYARKKIPKIKADSEHYIDHSEDFRKKIENTRMKAKFVQLKTVSCLIEIKKSRTGIKYFIKDDKSDALLDLHLVRYEDSEPSVAYAGHRCYELDQGKTLVVTTLNYSDCAQTVPIETFFVFSETDIEGKRFNVLGFRAYKKKRFSEAKNYFLQAIKKLPYDALINFNLACVMAVEGDSFENGKVHLENALRHGDVKEYLAKISSDPDIETWRKQKTFQVWIDKMRKELHKK